MNTIHMVDGSTIDMPEARFMKFIQMLTHRGIKSVRFDKTILIVSQSNIIRIEIGESDGQESDKPVVVSEVVEGPEVEEGDATDSREDEPKPEERPEGQDKKAERILKEMIEKSNCSNDANHLGHEQIIHKQQVTMKRKGSKAHITSTRFFPVCSFCGLKQRYVKADSLSEDQKDNAKLWTGTTADKG